MAGEQVDTAFVSSSGLVGDRSYALVDLAQANNQAWLTARSYPQLLSYSARYGKGALPLSVRRTEVESQPIEVKSPDGRVICERDDLQRTLSPDLNCEIGLHYSERGIVDAFPVSILGLGTVEQLAKESELNLDPRRFRANLNVEWGHSNSAFYEDELVGRELKIGPDVVLRVAKRDSRCKIVNLDPDTAEENRAVLKTVAQKHEGNAGVYAVVLQEGVVRGDDSIVLL